MKKLLTLTLALMALTIFVSCGEDDAPFGDNELVIGEEVMPLVGGYYYDNTYDLTNGLPRRTEGDVTTHVRRYMYLNDAATNNNAYIGIEFYSKGETFKNGTFTVKSYDDEVNADTESFVIIWAEANTEVYSFYGFDGMSGKITISSELEEVNPNNMTLKFNLEGVAYVPGVVSRQEGPSEEVEVVIKGQFKGDVALD